MNESPAYGGVFCMAALCTLTRLLRSSNADLTAKPSLLGDRHQLWRLLRLARFTGPGFPFGTSGAFFQMTDAARIAALASDANARVMVFVDGQNLYKTSRR